MRSETEEVNSLHEMEESRWVTENEGTETTDLKITGQEHSNSRTTELPTPPPPPPVSKEDKEEKS